MGRRDADKDRVAGAARQLGIRVPPLTDWRRRPGTAARRQLAEALSEPRQERAIGVVYRPETEFLSHYFEAVLADQFDAYVWFEETKAVTPLGAERRQGVPETYPFGL